MAGAAQGAHSSMDIADQKATFHGFLVATVWSVTLIIMGVALLTIAFAMNLGWFAGLAAFAAIGAGAGLLFKLPGAWWATLVAMLVLLGAGGVVFPAIFSLMN